MSKRSRNLKNIVIVLRGVPGSGKTTTAERIYDLFKDDYNYCVRIISRDSTRKYYCWKHDIDYQSSFRNPEVNTIVRDRYYEDIFIHLSYCKQFPSVTIIDSTNTKVPDLKHLLWTFRNSLGSYIDNFDFYVYTKRKEFGSTHGVPDCIMQRFREELKQSDEWLLKNSQVFNLKLINKLSFK